MEFADLLSVNDCTYHGSAANEKKLKKVLDVLR